MPPLAHAGHWLANLIYLAPVAIVVVMLAIQSYRDRRAGRHNDPKETP